MTVERNMLMGAAGVKAVGTFGIMTMGITTELSITNKTDKYVFATDTSSAGPTIPTVCSAYKSSAAGNSTRGILALGLADNSESTTRKKFTYSSECFSSATSASAAAQSGMAAGNSTVGIFKLGNSCSTSCRGKQYNKYTYSTDTNATTTGISSPYYYSSGAAGNSTRGIFALGSLYIPGCGTYASNARGKYTYACDTQTSATSSSVNSVIGAAAGNCTVGIFAIANSCNGSGSNVTTRNKYTYSTDANASATASSAAGQWQVATGNSVKGIFALGCNAGKVKTRNKYTYACNTNATAAAATYASAMGAGFANGVTGVNV